MKMCNRCNKIQEEDTCLECLDKYKKSKYGVVDAIFSKLKKREFSKEGLKNYLLNTEEDAFMKKYYVWVDSGYQNILHPNVTTPTGRLVDIQITTGGIYRHVGQYSTDWELVAEYPSITAASLATGVDLGNISSCCRGKLSNAGGFKWGFI